MASKSSKIAVTLQPSLKQKLREYGKENQIKNFSGVILAILDEYFGEGSSSATPPSEPAADDVWAAIRSLTARLDSLEGGAATTASTKASSPVSKPKLKTTKTRQTGTRAKTTASKPVAKRTGTKSTSKSATATKSTATKSTARKGRPPKTQKATAAKPKTTRPSKSSSKSAPAKKTTARKGSSTRKSTKSSKVEWMSTREAFETYGGKLSWSRFSKLTPEELKERFNLDSDLSRKVRGSRFNQWLKPGK